MKVSRFNYLVKSPREEHVHFLYNSLHDHRLAIEDGEIEIEELLEKVQQGRELNSVEYEAAKNLKELGVLLDDQEDEQAIFTDYLNKRVREQNEVLSVTLLTTMACNLRCTYCYEKERLGKLKMSEETLDKTIAWLKKRVDLVSPKKLTVIFFGGEPLLNVPAIRKVAESLIPYCKERGVQYEASMATNGIFLTPELADELRTYGVNWVKITFDGDKCEHDKKRIYSDGRGTFDKIFANLEACAGKMRFLIGGNFTGETADSFKKLLTKLKFSKFRDDIIVTNFKPIAEEVHDHEEYSPENIAPGCVEELFTEETTQKYLDIKDHSFAVSLGTSDPVNVGPCEFYLRNSLAIGVEGKIYKCIAFAGLSGQSIGDLDHQDYNELGESMIYVSKPYDHPKCSQCPFPPICGGGCRAHAHSLTGTYESISCQQDHFKRVIAAALPREHYDGITWSQAEKGNA